MVEDVGEAFAQIREDYDEWIASINEAGNPFEGEGNANSEYTQGGTDSPQNTYGPTGSGGTTPPPTYAKAREGASGLLFNTAGTTNLTVGEAGTETVAVLRNPRQMMMGGMGGGGAIIININNPVVRDNSDIEKIARAVEETLRQRSLLMRPQ